MGGPHQARLFFRTGMSQFGRDRFQCGNIGIRIAFVLAFDVSGGKYQCAGQGIDMLLQ